MKADSSTLRPIATGVAVLVVGELLLRWIFSSSAIDVMKWMWSLAIHQYSIPGWLVGSIAVGPLAIGYVISKLGGVTSIPDLYHEDHLFGMKWRWELGASTGTIHRLACFCPMCDNQIVDYRQDPKVYGQFPSFTFSCDCCKKKMGTVETVESEPPFDRVEREIQRRYRTGEFKQHARDRKEE